MANSNVLNLTVEFIKGNGKTQIYFSQSATTNITGRIVDITNYRLRGEDVSEYALDSKVTLCMESDTLAYALLNATDAEFHNRSMNGDANPVIAINFRANSISQTETGYLVYGISYADIAQDYVGQQNINVDTFKSRAANIRLATKQATEQSLAGNKPKLRPQAQAAALGMQMVKPEAYSTSEVPY